MKNMKKLVALFAATTMAMSMSISAFAATANVDDDLSLTFVVESVDTSKSEEAQITLLAYLVDEKDAEGAAYTADTAPDFNGTQEIVALNQVAGSTGFATIPLDTEKLIKGKAIAVRLGGSDGTVEKLLVVYNEEEQKVTILIGDVNGDGSVTGDDTLVLDAYCGAADKDAFNAANNKQIGSDVAKGHLIGDVNADGSVTGDDTLVLDAYCGAADKDAFNTANNKQIGVTVTIQ